MNTPQDDPPPIAGSMAMDPLALLVAEHRVIESVLDALDRYTGTLVTGTDEGTVDPARLADFVTFIRGYADAIHHGKEERILFATVKRHRVAPPLAALLASLERDHEAARRLTGDLNSFVGGVAHWTADDRARIRRLAREYTVLLRRHIVQEDKTTFPQAFAALPDAAARDVAAASQRFDAEHAAERENLLALARQLSAAS